jgi:hypothetical protein
MELKMTNTVQNVAKQNNRSFAIADITGGILAILLVAIII